MTDNGLEAGDEQCVNRATVSDIICDPICKNPEQSRIFQNLRFLYHGVLVA